MQLGLVGAGRVGGSMARRLGAAGHEVIVFDRNPDAVSAVASGTAIGASSIDDLVARISGPSGAGHFVKMIHNGIEYGLMQAYAEGFDILRNPSSDTLPAGEGRWTVAAAVEEAVPADVLTTALYARFRSRRDHTFADKLLSALRAQFGGHVEPPR